MQKFHNKLKSTPFLCLCLCCCLFFTSLIYAKNDDLNMVFLPRFSIEITMDNALKQLLYQKRESIIVLADFTGEPDKSIPKQYQNRINFGEFNLTSKRIELIQKRNIKRQSETKISSRQLQNNIATFENINIPENYYNLIQKHNIKVLINVFTGRHSSNDNLIQCGILYEDLSKIANKTTQLNCKLINIYQSINKLRV